MAENMLCRWSARSLVVAAGLACGLFAGVTASVAQEPPAGDGGGGTGAPASPLTSAPDPDTMRRMGGGGGGGGDDSELKPFAEVGKDFEKIVSTVDSQDSLYTIFVRRKDNQMLAELPRGWENQKHFIALTVASGELYAGLQAGDFYVYWKRQGNRMVLLEPQIETRSTGDAESKSSVKRLFTDRVLLDVPIVAMGPSGQPVIDMDDLLVKQAGIFFGPQARAANTSLATIKTAKAFPQNVELAFEMPMSGGRLQRLHYSISLIPDSTGYLPRTADERVGFFTTTFRDLGKFVESEKWVRYVNRWHLEKRDPKLLLSPPKEPIVFVVEHTVPVRYRHWVREGALAWNKAFERIGIRDAVEVVYQDAETGANMEKDPEDVRYNYIRWLNNDIGTAIGPSRVHPLTGQILDADVILTDGWIRHFWTQYNEVLPEVAMEGFSPETLAWLETRPNWDPRVRLAPPELRNEILAAKLNRGIQKYGGHALAASDATIMGDQEYDGLVGRVSQVNGMCMAARGKAFDMAIGLMTLEMQGLLDGELASSLQTNDEPTDGKPEAKKDDEKKPDGQPEGKAEDKKDAKTEKPKFDTLDGIPDWFIGPMLQDLVMHEVGHTLGLRHNFRASSLYTMGQINSEEMKGKKPVTGSVMDYTPININMNDGKVQGDYTMMQVGPYDLWAIEYGYTTEDPKKVLARVAETELTYATDEDTMGPDPLARRYDYSANPLEYADSSMRLAKYHRERLMDKFVKDGESWAKLRRGYNVTLGMQTRSINMMSAWIGGTFVNRDRKGDPNGRSPLTPVPVQQQRDALKFVIVNSFDDAAFGLTPDMLTRMTVDKWMDSGGMREAMGEATYPIHDRIMGVQSSALTMLMNPTTLRRIYDNEIVLPSGQDALTLPELLDAVSSAIWTEIETQPGKKFTSREPMISSLRRNLQQEHIERLIDLSLNPGSGAASRPISTLSYAKLRQVKEKITQITDGSGKGNLDPYTSAHLEDAKTRITKALDAQYLYNGLSMPDFSSMMFMGREAEKK